ncbi:hypothetical protein BDE18_1279 [Paracoccus pantotrophus]|uniref:Uncharacterized protein n=1 Tax=Paracoccus pantotrophus TaxID=82367 RepID=A0AAE6TU59_PARPN|nr:hypothetical protein [Paracoccus pantotrophus]QFG37561.1 hypothetical protein ESD82_15670 [Paracoccus pantotrophus]RKS51987.1 hypothetical protein BDE18_1279 [Paracoccus pantotrophus]
MSNIDALADNARRRVTAWNETYRKFIETLGAHPPTGAFFYHPAIDEVAEAIVSRKAIHPGHIRDEVEVYNQAAHLLREIALDGEGNLTIEGCDANDCQQEADEIAQSIKSRQGKFLRKRAHIARLWLLMADLLQWESIKNLFLPDVTLYNSNIEWEVVH